MTLSFLHSWRCAKDTNLITRVGVASSAPAPLSRRLTTQTAWRQTLSRAPARCTLHSPVECHQASVSLIRRLYSHQATAEDSEPAALSLAPGEATTSFQRRRLRARQLAQEKPSQKSAVKPRKNPHKLPKPHEVLRRNDRILRRAARATQEVHLAGATEAPEFRQGGNQEDKKGGIHTLTFERYYYKKWAPVEAADVEHLQAVQAAVGAAVGAARKAEDLARWAEKAAEEAAAAVVSSNETSAIQLADAARTEADLAALDAEQKAQLAADKEEAAEALRAEMRVRVERKFPYWFEDRTKLGLSDKMRGLVHSPCRICHASHSLSECHLLFPALNRRDTEVDPRYRALFRDKLALDNKFREGIGYIQSTFQVSSGSFGEVVPLSRNVTRDAPASAIKYLQEFDTRVVFKYILGGKYGPGLTRINELWDIQPGHYITTDDDGRAFGIYWPSNAPADMAADYKFLLELQIIRSFVSAWGKGEKARYGQDPFSDMPSIDIVIVAGRWHRTRTRSDDMRRAVLSLWISNEELWKQGLYYKGIHIGTKDDEITSGYDWWSYGRPEMHGSPVIDLHAAPIPSSTSEVRAPVAKRLLQSTLRSVVERVQPILNQDIKKRDPVALSLYKKFQLVLRYRSARKYGQASVQHRLINDTFRGSAARRAVGDRYPQWAPSWEIMMRLDADAEAFETRRTRPLFVTLRRQRLLRSRPSPASDSTSTDHPPRDRGYQVRSIISPDPTPGTEVASMSAPTGHPPRASGYRMRSIMFPDPAPGTEAISSIDAGTPVVDPVSALSASSQQTNPEFQIRMFLYSADSAQKNTNPCSKMDANSTGRSSKPRVTRKHHNLTLRDEEIISTPDLTPETGVFGGPEAQETLDRRMTRRPQNRRPRSSGYRAGALLSALDLSPEISAAAGSSKPEEGREEAVEYRPMTRGRQGKGTRKFLKSKVHHEFPVPDSGDVCSF